jgi:hypothetical protein
MARDDGKACDDAQIVNLPRATNGRPWATLLIYAVAVLRRLLTDCSALPDLT